MRDTGDFLVNGPGRDGEMTTSGVVRELARRGRYVLLGAAEIYMLPATISAGLVTMAVAAGSKIAGVNPSSVDLGVMVSGILTGLPVRSEDGDVHVSMAAYYLQLPQRMVYADVIWGHIGRAMELSTKYGPAIDLLLKLYAK